MNNAVNKAVVYGRIIDWVGLSSIGIFCLCYSVFWSSFAEIHITLPFLDFPIFVGEILLAGCMVLLVLKWKVMAFRFNAWYYLLGAYVGWVLIKALSGYFVFGPLAFRNAALFYYPLFAIISYHFFSKDYFSQTAIAVLSIIFLTAKVFIGFIKYFFFPYFALSLILILKIERRWLRYLACILLLYLFSYEIFFHGSRSFLLGNITAFLFLIFSFIFGVLKIERKYKVYFLLVMLAILAWGVFKFSRSARQIESLMAPVRFMEKFREYDEFIQRQKKGFKPQELKAQLYNENSTNYINKALGRVEEGKAREQQEEVSVKDAMVIIERKLDATIEETVAKKDIFEEVTLKDAVDVAAEVMKEQKKMLLEVIGGEGNKDVLKKKQQIMEISQRSKEIFKNYEHTIKGGIAGSGKTNGEDSIREKKALEAVSKPQNRAEVTSEPGVVSRNEIASAMEEFPRKGVFLKPVREKKALEHLIRDVKESLVEQAEIVLEGVTDVRLAVTKSARTLNEEQGNMLFRIFIWRDMLSDLAQEKPLFGFSFGKPQRSLSIEILDQARGEWTRDGWITPHNGFLHVIYRAGIIGAFMIAGFFTVLFALTKEFIQKRAVTGLLLVSILIFWIVVASFLVVLELPYQAIPFWALFGIALSYGRTLKGVRV